jgi:uncharacterized protein
MNKPYFVIDNNVLVSKLLLPNSVSAHAVQLAIENGILLISEETLAELAEVLSRKKFDKYVSTDDRKTFINKLQVISQKVEIIERIMACRDAKDDKFLELAINGNAKFIITGDRDLLVLNIFKGIEVITSQDFITRLS